MHIRLNYFKYLKKGSLDRTNDKTTGVHNFTKFPIVKNTFKAGILGSNFEQFLICVLNLDWQNITLGLTKLFTVPNGRYSIVIW